MSMRGHLGDCAVETLVLMILALQELGIDNFSVVLFGSRVGDYHRERILNGERLCGMCECW